jgi:putative PIN family toxin of toxin-antitoxin system
MIPSMSFRVVIDTNVLVSALRSKNGASYRLLSLVGSRRFQPCLSVPLAIEYEAAAKKLVGKGGLSVADINTIIDYMCKVSEHHLIYFLWRPTLKDSKDDMVLELAVAASADAIVTFNKADFKGTDKFGIRVIAPQQLLKEIGDRK